MKILIKESQYLKQLMESDNPIEPKLVILFKALNEEKKKHKTTAALLERIKSLMNYFNIPEGFEIYILELYLLNFRKDGDYSSINKDNFVDPRKMKGKWTTNTRSNLYTKAQLPFKGSNLQAYWSKDFKGSPYYVVVSYGWYPIYLFKDNKWYEVTKRYSSSTGRQMSNANPVDWDPKIDEEVITVTPEEIKLLQNGRTFEEIMKNKVSSIVKKQRDLLSSRMRTAKIITYAWNPDANRKPSISIKFKIKSVNVEDDKSVVDVDIYDVLKVDDKSNREIPTKENYMKGEIENITPEYVEDSLRQRIIWEFKDYIGRRIRWNRPLPEKSKVKFKFNHLKT